MIVLCHVEHSHASVVGADIVQCLHHFKRIAYGFGLCQSLVVCFQSLVKSAFVAQMFAYFSVCDDAAQHIALAFHAFLQHGECVDIVRRGHEAVESLTFGMRIGSRFLSARNQQQYDQAPQCGSRYMSRVIHRF